MAFTQTDIDNCKTAITTIISRGAARVEINGRMVEFLSLDSLTKMIEYMEGDLNGSTYGGYMPIEFKEVTT